MHFLIPTSFIWMIVLFIELASSQSYLNSSSSISESTISADDCQALQDAWNAASSSFEASVWSGWTAGIYSTTFITIADSYPETLYSYDLSNLYTETFGSSTVTAQYAASTVATILTTVIVICTITIDQPRYDVPFPSCTVTYAKLTFSQDCRPCAFYAPNVQLLYFPVSTVAGNPNLTVTPTGTTVPSGVYNGMTYTSGNVYFKYDNISALNGCFSPIGSFYPGAVVTLRSDEVSSLRNDGTYFDGAYSFNYADLNYPVPWSAWIGQFGCADEYPGCWPVETGPYNPYVSIPSEVRNLDPAWASCTMDPGAGSWDPPYALTPEGILTQPGSTTLPTAIPAHKPTSQAYSTYALTTQSAGEMSPSTSEAVDPPSFTEITATSTATTIVVSVDRSGDPQAPTSPSSTFRVPSADPQVPTGDPDTSTGGSPGDLSLQPLFSAKTIFTISNSVISLGPTAATVILPGHTTPAQLSSVNPAAVGIVIGSELLAPGGQIFAPGTTYSLPPTPTAIVIDGSTMNLPSQLYPITIPAMMTFGSTFITQDAASDFIIGSQTLTPGGEITVSGTTVSLPLSPTAVLIDGITFDLSTASKAIAILPAITVGASIITEDAASDFLIGSHTLIPGGEITVSGDVISLEASAAAIIFGTTSTEGLGAIIIGGFGATGVPSATGASTSIHFVTGTASTRGLGWWTDMVKTKVMLHVALILVATFEF